ncbi:DUF732 domain-containing protein [Curtobacterium sp. 22159]|uniref:DUF732 domain-containing protein n=1 Tax=Curtobacterium sp. 22159 TaxID=3453882 RepID=UPI003F86A484
MTDEARLEASPRPHRKISKQAIILAALVVVVVIAAVVASVLWINRTPAPISESEYLGRVGDMPITSLVSNSEIDSLGKSICGRMDRDPKGGWQDIVKIMTDGDDSTASFSSKNAVGFVNASIARFCPEHLKDVK